jgi:hypothetical protein
VLAISEPVSEAHIDRYLRRRPHETALASSVESLDGGDAIGKWFLRIIEIGGTNIELQVSIAPQSGRKNWQRRPNAGLTMLGCRLPVPHPDRQFLVIACDRNKFG